MNQLKSDDYPEIYRPYIEKVTGNVMSVMKSQLEDYPAFIKTIPSIKGQYSYAEGKWTVKEVLGHIVDTERIMAYRALRFARNDTKALAGFEQDDYVLNGNFNERSINNIVHEWITVRQATISLFETFGRTELARKGLASDRLISVKAFAYIIVGHLNHHREILILRYLNQLK
ncbi:DinB family protein [Olivibacter sitiensis]|uniref:DinB family protein n=1 Tax=Olivibacter sitiensis TaxID=376470 RepID=UPI0004125822|nr:DinB family protein [Olivibacter sitiensis]